MERGGLIENSGIPSDTRKKMFYLICIPTRLLMVGLVFKYENNPTFIYICMLLSIVAIFMNLNKTKVWWDRNIHLLNALSILVVSLAGYPEYIKYILISDVVHGLLSSLKNKPWE